MLEVWPASQEEAARERDSLLPHTQQQSWPHSEPMNVSAGPPLHSGSNGTRPGPTAAVAEAGVVEEPQCLPHIRTGSREIVTPAGQFLTQHGDLHARKGGWQVPASGAVSISANGSSASLEELPATGPGEPAGQPLPSGARTVLYSTTAAADQGQLLPSPFGSSGRMGSSQGSGAELGGAGAAAPGVLDAPAARGSGGPSPAGQVLQCQGFWRTLWELLGDVYIVSRGHERRAFWLAIALAFWNQAFASTAIINYAPQARRAGGGEEWAGWAHRRAECRWE